MFFFFKQKTAYEMRISDWSSDVCSSDLIPETRLAFIDPQEIALHRGAEIGGPQLVGAAVFAVPAMREFVREQPAQRLAISSEERRVGKECVSTCRSRWSPYH